MKEDEILAFVRDSIGSVWALEVLVLLRRDAGRSWDVKELVHELRSSPAAVEGAAELLTRAGLIARAGDEALRYQPASPELDEIAGFVQTAYSTKPATFIAALFEPSDERLRTFAAAFKFRE